MLSKNTRALFRNNIAHGVKTERVDCSEGMYGGGGGGIGFPIGEAPFGCGPAFA